MREKLNVCSIFRIFCIVSFILWMPQIKVDAASFQMTGRNIKTGAFYIWGSDDGTEIRYSKSSSGRGSVLVKCTKGRRISDYRYMLSDGIHLYYGEHIVGKSEKGYLYRLNIKKREKKLLGEINNLFCVCGYYKGNLYINCSDFSEDGPIDTVNNVYRYNLKNHKKNKVMSDIFVRTSKGRYLAGMPLAGDLGPLPLYVYDCKNQKKLRITKKGCDYNLYKGKLYYSEFADSDIYTSPYRYNIKRCDLNGKNKKVLKKNLHAGYIGRITDQYVYYSKYIGNKEKYYCYNLKRKTVRQISKKSYGKNVGWN